MFNKYMILTREFRNVTENGNVTGFQVKIRIPYYRGVRLSLIDTVQLTVDGEDFPMDKMTFTVGGRTYTFAELGKVTDTEWFFGNPATLTAKKPGGLATGMHTVQLGIVIRKSYLPKNDPNLIYGFPKEAMQFILHGMERATKKMSLV
jgi:Domain of unknown function (DUF6379)